MSNARMAATDSSRHSFARTVSQVKFSQEAIRAKAAGIYHTALTVSQHLQAGNFRSISVRDLQFLYARYDAEFFGGAIQKEVRAQADGRLSFRLSRRMTSTGGKMTRFRRSAAPRRGLAAETSFEITISTTLLYQSFDDVQRTVRVNGLACSDRLEALQRVFEHELLHLVEMLAFGDSQCSAPRYKRLAADIFGHSDVKHDLVLQHERAASQYSVRPGDKVRFDLEGVAYEGVINRITRRATVLVEHAQGQSYTDGKRYQKFYVPLALLRKL